MKNRNITFTATLLVVACFALLPKSLAVNPPPDGGYAGSNTAEGQNALLSLTGGTFNTAIGTFSLKSTPLGSLTLPPALTRFLPTPETKTQPQALVRFSATPQAL